MLSPHAVATQSPFENLSELNDLSLSFAYQPIVKGRQAEVVAYEAMVRGVAGQPAQTILSRIGRENRERFDQAIRLRAIRNASRLEIDKPLHLNCSWLEPHNVSAALVGMLNMASVCGLARGDLVLELQNLDRFESLESLDTLRRRLKTFHVRVLVDKFGAGKADLARLAVLRPDMVKLDRSLVSGIHRSRARQAIVTGIVATCRSLGIHLIALGVEDAAELYWLSANGVDLFQGFYFAHPAIDRLPDATRMNGSSQSRGFGLEFASPSRAAHSAAR